MVPSNHNAFAKHATQRLIFVFNCNSFTSGCNPKNMIKGNRSKNLATLKIDSAQAQVKQGDFSACLDCLREPFDFIFIDPPYCLDCGIRVLEKIVEKGLLTQDGIAVYERDCPFSGEIKGLELFDERKYGKAYLTFFRRA